MSDILFTGFPGFLGKSLLPRILKREKKSTAVCLVQSKFKSQAQKEASKLERQFPEIEGRVVLVEGDITVPGLGLSKDAVSLDNISEVYHLAAVYDLSVGRDFAYKVNVDGTKHVLDFIEKCPNFSRLQYISTCYVSGRYAGIFSEDDLDVGQSFNNFYEETKFHAERLVRERMEKNGLAASIYRPSIVVGDSQTGFTQKYDGPYFVIQWLLRQPKKAALLPVVGDPKMVRINVVPCDFVVDAIAYLSGLKGTVGKAFNLADPNALTVEDMMSVISTACDRNVIPIHLPYKLAVTAIDHVPGVYSFMRIPSTLVDYMVHPTFYDTKQTQKALSKAGVEVPHFETYLPKLVDFVKTHPEVGSKAMV